MRAPITLGLHMPNFDFPGVSADGVFERVVEMVRTAEASGFSSVSVMDHLHQIPVIGPQEHFMFEGNVMLAALAARTERVHLGVLVGGVTYRNPALLAKMTTSLDVISGGRAIFGIGAAWFEDEHVAYGFEFPPLKERFVHLEDALRIARAMFTEERATVEGKHHRVSQALNNPKPLRGDIPILIGGSGERKTLRLVAKYADGCNISGDLERCKHLLAVLDQHCEDVGRDPAEITRTRNSTVLVADTEEGARLKIDALRARGLPEERIAASVVAGTPDSLAEQAQAFRDIGIEAFTCMVPDAHDLEPIEQIGRALAPVFG